MHIAKTLSKYSPVSILVRYMREAKLTPPAICRCSVQSFKQDQVGIYDAFFETFSFESSGSVTGSFWSPGMRFEKLWPS